MFNPTQSQRKPGVYPKRLRTLDRDPSQGIITHRHTITNNLEMPINPQSMFLDLGWNNICKIPFFYRRVKMSKYTVGRKSKIKK